MAQVINQSIESVSTLDGRTIITNPSPIEGCNAGLRWSASAHKYWCPGVVPDPSAVVTPAPPAPVPSVVVLTPAPAPPPVYDCNYYGNCYVPPPAPVPVSDPAPPPVYDCNYYGNCYTPAPAPVYDCNYYGNCYVPPPAPVPVSDPPPPVYDCNYYGNCFTPAPAPTLPPPPVISWIPVYGGSDSGLDYFIAIDNSGTIVGYGNGGGSSGYEPPSGPPIPINDGSGQRD